MRISFQFDFRDSFHLLALDLPPQQQYTHAVKEVSPRIMEKDNPIPEIPWLQNEQAQHALEKAQEAVRREQNRAALLLIRAKIIDILYTGSEPV